MSLNFHDAVLSGRTSFHVPKSNHLVLITLRPLQPAASKKQTESEIPATQASWLIIEWKGYI